MKIEKYNLINEPNHGWNFPPTNFERINLIVGDSGTGKSRFLNTISNFAKTAVAEKVKHIGEWEVVFSISENQYQWNIKINGSSANDTFVDSEKLVDLSSKKILIDRNNKGFFFRGEKLPKLSSQVSSISLFKEEDEISDIYSGFKSIITRRFYSDELSKNFGIFSFPEHYERKYSSDKKISDLIHEEIGFINKLRIFKNISKHKYEELISFYKDAFPFIEMFDFIDNSKLPDHKNLPFKTKIFCFKERSLDHWIPVNDISSGMQKVFLIALDIYLLSNGGILIIDEYENSLGINAINVLPGLMNSNNRCQYLISSHHPYMINSIPIEDWIVFNRKGTDVKLKLGKDLKEKFGKSRQQHFIQLINDPFYTEGIE